MAQRRISIRFVALWLLFMALLVGLGLGAAEAGFGRVVNGTPLIQVDIYSTGLVVTITSD